MGDTIFHKIMRGESPADIVYSDDDCIVIRDIFPQMQTHLLVIPRTTIALLAEARTEHRELLGHLLLVAKGVAARLGFADAYLVRINNGEEVGMTVPQLHIHIMSPRPCELPAEPLSAADIASS